MNTFIGNFNLSQSCMLKILERIFENGTIETPQKQHIEVHSHTSKDQCIFLQEIFDKIAPKKSLEVGLAFWNICLSYFRKA